MTDVAKIAKGLTASNRRNLAALPKEPGIWMTVSEMAHRGATGSGMDVLRVMRGLCERRWVKWGSDRINHQLRGEGYEYSINADGLALRAFLQSEGSE